MVAEVVPAQSKDYDRQPPQDLAAEQSVLGGMLLSKDAIADVVEVLRSTDFYRPAHSLIYDVVLDLYGKGEPADAVTVAAELSRRGEIARAGGAPYLHTLISSVPTAAHAGYYARIVAERAILRRLVEAGTRIVQLGYAGQGDDVDEIVDRAQAAVYEVTERRTSEDYVRLEHLLQGTLDEIDAIGSRGGSLSGVPTGFADLDALTNGLHPGQLVIIAARPAVGKCLAGSSLVTEARTGERLTIAELVARGQAGERLAVTTVDERWRLQVVEPAAYLDNGVRPVFTLRTAGGRVLRATANHPLLTLSGWVPLEALAAGTPIAVAARAGDVDPRTAALPAAVWDLVDKARGPMTWAELGRRSDLPRPYDWEATRRADVPRHLLRRFARVLRDGGLADLAASETAWDAVVSISRSGEERVYDLTIDGTHNFVADDIVVHNSTLGLDFARSASIKHSMASCIFSLEMSKSEIVMRLLSAEARVSLGSMRTGRMSDDDWARLARRMGEVADAPLYIDDSPNLTMMEIRAKARRLKQQQDLQLVVVDYMQLMSSPKRVENRQQEVSEISRSLKLLAKELEVPVVAISQLNRGSEQRADKKPMLSDLRESGCLTASTRLLRADTNAEVTLGELLASGETEVPVWSVDESLRVVRRTLTHAFPSGTKEVFRLRLTSGREIEATANHKFLTYDGWKPLGELSAGARLAAPRITHAPERVVEWPSEHVVLLAHLLGDGSFVRRQPIRYASIDEANLTAVAEAAQVFGVTAVRDDYPAARVTTLRLPAPFHLTHGRRNPIAAWLDELGLFGLRSHEKFVPAAVHAMTKRQVALFLRHLWATDGSVRWDGAARQARLYYASTSRRLVDDIALLLLRFGILSRIKTTTKPGYRDCYHLVIYGAENQQRFLEKIGVHGARGVVAEATVLPALRELKGNTNVDTVPPEVWRKVRDIVAEREMTHREFAAAMQTQFCGSTMWKHAPSRGRLARVAAVLHDADLDLLATSEVHWDEIASIESIGRQEVYDATVLGTHNFIANGIVAHNSLEQDADMVILLYREDVFEPESPRAGEADMIVAKHRNGPTDTITVAFQGRYSRFVDMSPG